MGRSDASITVYCDETNCGSSIQIDLTKLAMRGAWDERNVDSELEREGWTLDKNNNYHCFDCTEGWK